MTNYGQPSETYDFAVTATLRAGLRVSEYVGNGRSVPKGVRPGARVTITYYQGATNCGIRAHRRDNTIIDRDFVATPGDVLVTTGRKDQWG
jgi:hypothetical protein